AVTTDTCGAGGRTSALVVVPEQPETRAVGRTTPNTNREKTLNNKSSLLVIAVTVEAMSVPNGKSPGSQCIHGMDFVSSRGGSRNRERFATNAGCDAAHCQLCAGIFSCCV